MLYILTIWNALINTTLKKASNGAILFFQHNHKTNKLRNKEKTTPFWTKDVNENKARLIMVK